MGEKGEPMEYLLYISLAGEDKISIYALDHGTGKLTLQQDVSVSNAPGPLTMDPTGRFMYAGLRSTRELASFKVNPDSGVLALTRIVETSGINSDPCYITTDRTGHFLLSAHYHKGMVVVHPIDADGKVGEQAIQVVETASHAHCIQTDPRNNYVYVPHTVPPNLILQFAFDEATGTLTPLDRPKATVPEGSGPRHYCFHPTRNRVYFSGEQGSSVIAYSMDPSTGTLAMAQTVSSLPGDYEGRNAPAQIHIHPTGRFLYLSNRGHDTIAGFSIDGMTGDLTLLGQCPTEPGPRAFNLDPMGRYLFAAGQGSGRLATYRIDERTGALSALDSYEVGENPMWVLVTQAGSHR
jgi:6-phosphogluconolactonase